MWTKHFYFIFPLRIEVSGAEIYRVSDPHY